MRTLKNSLTSMAIAFMMSMAFPSCASAQQLSYNLQRASELYFSDEDEEAAIKLIKKELNVYPNNSDALYLRARIAYDNERYGSAISDLSAAIKNYDRKKIVVYLHNLYLWRANTYEDINETDKAKADYDYAAKLVLKSKQKDQIQSVLFEQASFYYRIGDLDGSDAIFSQMIKNDDTDQTAMVGLSRNYIKRGEYIDAVNMLEKCEMLSDDYSEIYRFRMQAYYKLNDCDKAIDAAIMYLDVDDNPSFSVVEDAMKKHLSYGLAKVSERIVKEKKQAGFWLFVRARIYEWQHNYHRAIEQYDYIVKEYGYDVRTSLRLAECYSQVGSANKAAKEMTRVIEKEGDDVSYFFLERADYYRLAGNYEAAIVDFDKVIEMDPADCFAYYRKGWCYELMGNNEKALECYDAGIDVEKDYAYIYLNRGELLRQKGMNELAEADFNTILQLDTIPESGSCRQYALHFLGRDEEALEWMDKIVESDEDRAGGYYDRSCLLARMGRLQEAIESLKDAIEHGYSQLIHIEHDDDMDPLRNMSEYKAIITELKDRITQGYDEQEKTSGSDSLVCEVPMVKHPGGTYEVACAINDLPLTLILDTGASDVTISNIEANFMLKNGYLKESDIKGKKYYQVASGEIKSGTTITIREIKIGDTVLKNVDASVVDSQTAPLLLGQSAFGRFGTITIDNINSKLIIKNY